MDKKPFDRSQPQQPTKPDAGSKTPEALDKNKTPSRPGAQPGGPPIDKGTSGGGLGRKDDVLEGQRSDRESGRPVQLGKDDDGKGNRRDADAGGRRPDDQKAADGQTVKR
jgi:hypothetical protein